MSRQQRRSPSKAEPEGILDLFRRMWLLRAFEETVAVAHERHQLPGLLHLSIGAEAVAVGVIAQLRPDDRIYSTHRPHGHFLAAGVAPAALMAELAGRSSGVCGGRGGSMHLMSDRAVMATGVVGGTLPIALGHALAIEEPNVVIAFFGDGAAQTGVFTETLNLASLWGAPVLFVCENNGWAEFSAREEHTKVSTVARYATLYGLPASTIDGADVESVRSAAGELLEGVRSGSGPALLECTIIRLRPHYEGDLRARIHDSTGDPIARAAARLKELGTKPADIAKAEEDATAGARVALESALADPVPDPASDLSLVFARQVP